MYDVYNIGSVILVFCLVRKFLNRERVVLVFGGVLEIYNFFILFCFRKLGMVFVKINNFKFYGVFW